MIINFEFIHENSLGPYFIEKNVGKSELYQTLKLLQKTECNEAMNMYSIN